MQFSLDGFLYCRDRVAEQEPGALLSFFLFSLFYFLSLSVSLPAMVSLKHSSYFVCFPKKFHSHTSSPTQPPHTHTHTNCQDNCVLFPQFSAHTQHTRTHTHTHTFCEICFSRKKILKTFCLSEHKSFFGFGITLKSFKKETFPHCTATLMAFFHFRHGNRKSAIFSFRQDMEGDGRKLC